MQCRQWEECRKQGKSRGEKAFRLNAIKLHDLPLLDSYVFGLPSGLQQHIFPWLRMDRDPGRQQQKTVETENGRSTLSLHVQHCC
jgi:hypothetical protein